MLPFQVLLRNWPVHYRRQFLSPLRHLILAHYHCVQTFIRFGLLKREFQLAKVEYSMKNQIWTLFAVDKGKKLWRLFTLNWNFDGCIFTQYFLWIATSSDSIMIYRVVHRAKSLKVSIFCWFSGSPWKVVQLIQISSI